MDDCIMRLGWSKGQVSQGEKARTRARTAAPDRRRRVDAGAPVQQQPHHLHVATLGRHDEACGSDLRRQGECAGSDDQECRDRGLGVAATIGVKVALDGACSSLTIVGSRAA
jgi:hypothetical protein